jgi:ribose transport system ATP-binding protein
LIQPQTEESLVERVDQSRTEIGSAPLLAMAGLVKRFTGTLALDHVDFEVRRGEVHALLGQNGAGKSTLIKILAGVYGADAGEIRFAGILAHPGTDSLPIAFIHQDLGLVEWMTVAENVAIQTGYPRSRFGLISWRRVQAAAAEALAIMGSDLDPDALISSLPAAERSLVAIGRALAIKSDIVVLDEPTAALPEADVERLLETLRRLRANGIGVVFVTHRLDEVFRIADRVTVLRDGRRLATVPTRETNAADLVQMIVGRSMTDAFVKPAPATARRVLSVRDLAAEHAGPVSFSVTAGEVLGLVGLRGAGHHTIGRAIFGETRVASGRMLLDGESVAPRSPAEAMAMGIGFVSSRRAEEGIASNLEVRENIYMNPTASGKSVLEFISRATEVHEANAAARRFSIKAASVEQPAATLSGGNQQKVVIARWMEAQVRLLILEEPTIGVDVGAKADIYHLLQLSLSNGLAALLISSDFEEVERICHRALVFSRGQLAAEIPREALTVAALTASASGGAAARRGAMP